MKKKNLMKSLTALVLSVLMVLSGRLRRQASDGGKDEDKDGYIRGHHQADGSCLAG